MVDGTARRDQKTDLHPDNAAVDKFARLMKEKLADARTKGRSGWQHCPEQYLLDELRKHIRKGDMRDVANFAMMIHFNRETNVARILQSRFGESYLDD